MLIASNWANFIITVQCKAGASTGLGCIVYLSILESKENVCFTLYDLKYTQCHIYCCALFLVCFYDKVTYLQRFEVSLKLCVDLHLVLLKNNLRIVLASNKQFKNI